MYRFLTAGYSYKIWFYKPCEMRTFIVAVQVPYDEHACSVASGSSIKVYVKDMV